jgi:predicted DNA-binding protein (UPF0251 family)
MSKVLDIKIELPDTVPEETARLAEIKAQEAVVLTLWMEEELTTRQAAAELGLSYDEFLDVLTERGIPIERGCLDLRAIEVAEEKLSGGSA